MNKKIVSEIAVGVILLITIIVGGIFWMQGEKNLQKTEFVNQQEEEVPTEQKRLREMIAIDAAEQKKTLDEQNAKAEEQAKLYFVDLKYDNLKCFYDKENKEFYIKKKDQIVAKIQNNAPEGKIPGCELEKIGKNNLYVGLRLEGRDTPGPDYLFAVDKRNYNIKKIFDFFISTDLPGYLRDISNNETMYSLVSYGREDFNKISIYSMDGNKKYEFASPDSGTIISASFSPDDKKIAYSYSRILLSNDATPEYTSESGIYVINLETGMQEKIKDGKSNNSDITPVYTDGWKNNNEVNIVIAKE